MKKERRKSERKERKHRERKHREKKERRTDRIRIRHPGSLKRFGYSLDKPAKERRRALRKAAKEYGRKKVDEKLGALKGFFRSRPEDRRKVEQDEKALKSN